MSKSNRHLSLTKGKLFLAIAGPSGGGKSTLCSLLLEKYGNLVLSISNTTRNPRNNEVEGTHYFFTSESKFQSLISSGEMVEWARVHGSLYGTSKEFLTEAESESKIVLLDIDVQGVQSFEQKYPQHTVSIFLHPPSMEELEKRLRKRGTDSDQSIDQRMKNAKDEISHGEKFKHQIINQDLDDTFQKVCEVIEAEFGVEGGDTN